MSLTNSPYTFFTKFLNLILNFLNIDGSPHETIDQNQL